MAKYRKKPVEIEAVQFIAGSEVPAMKFLGLDDSCRLNRKDLIYENKNAFIEIHQPEVVTLIIKTLEGAIKANNGDYIIKGIGEFYPCKPDIFEKTYEEVK